MQDKELYHQLLGLKDSWKVSEVRVDFQGLKVDIWVTWPPEEKALCPECGKFCLIYDHREERQWRHLDTMQFQTILHCRIPRVECTEHGVKSIEVPCIIGTVSYRCIVGMSESDEGDGALKSQLG